ncbi:Galactokinase [Frankliniella fusca]|uniref:Galactokinase n=1 Tax=Frankliniella fusca TaxID=407009 RepID=A0AAE1HC05_9NEOP|nr:Galactokinase [Frankliniella fusca]
MDLRAFFCFLKSIASRFLLVFPFPQIKNTTLRYAIFNKLIVEVKVVLVKT